MSTVGPGNVDTPHYLVPSISSQTVAIKRQILIGYSLIVILALPLWWYTTSIQRLSLPIERVHSVEKTKDIFSLIVNLKGEYSGTSDLARTLQEFVDRDKSHHSASWEGLQIQIHDDNQDVALRNQAIYTIQVHPEHVRPEGKPGMWTDGRTLNVISNSSDGSLSQSIGVALCELLAPYRRGTSRMQERSATRYSKTYRLAFSVLVEDPLIGIDWDVEDALNHYLYPVLEQLNQSHSFTVESQVQLHAPLAFDPPSITSQSGETHYVLDEDELKIFINSAEWTLSSSVSEEPVLHFVLFIPSIAHYPLTIAKRTDHNAFIVPQWGGIVILKEPRTEYLRMSDLKNPFATFQAQLLILLGVPAVSVNSLEVQSKQFVGLSEWQLDALHRRRTIENLKDSTEALSSIVNLVDQIQNMPVGVDVRGDVENALNAIEKASSNSINSSEALHFSAKANELSSRAFFNPGMLALLYFPPEHKYAVYVPLFGPVSLPFLLVIFKETRKWLQERRALKLKLE